MHLSLGLFGHLPSNDLVHVDVNLESSTDILEPRNIGQTNHSERILKTKIWSLIIWLARMQQFHLDEILKLFLKKKTKKTVGSNSKA